MLQREIEREPKVLPGLRHLLDQEKINNLQAELDRLTGLAEQWKISHPAVTLLDDGIVRVDNRKVQAFGEERVSEYRRRWWRAKGVLDALQELTDMWVKSANRQQEEINRIDMNEYERRPLQEYVDTNHKHAEQVREIIDRMEK